MIKTWNRRHWLRGIYVWNMFDFASDLRDEGGVKGMNNKGLVTHDRSIKKDSFYMYKAYRNDEPFVHIAFQRYARRPKGKIVIEVISNLGEVELFVDGKSRGSRKVHERTARFEDLRLSAGEHSILVRGTDPRGVDQNGVELPDAFIAKINKQLIIIKKN